MMQVVTRESDIKETERLLDRAAICGLHDPDSERDRGLMLKQILRNQLLIMKALKVGNDVPADPPLPATTGVIARGCTCRESSAAAAYCPIHY